MSRHPQSVLDEVAYWQLMLGDLLDLNDQVCAVADTFAHLAIDTLPLAFPTGAEQVAAAVSRRANVGLDACKQMQAVLDRLLELSNGRQLMLRAEVEQLKEGGSA